MSFQEQLISNMFDPTNRLVTKMVDAEAINKRNEGQQTLATGTVAQQALWTYDAQGRLVMREIDEAVSIAEGINRMNTAAANKSQAQPDDIATIVANAVTAALLAFTQQTATATP